MIWKLPRSSLQLAAKRNFLGRRPMGIGLDQIRRIARYLIPTFRTWLRAGSLVACWEKTQEYKIWQSAQRSKDIHIWRTLWHFLRVQKFTVCIGETCYQDFWAKLSEKTWHWRHSRFSLLSAKNQNSYLEGPQRPWTDYSIGNITAKTSVICWIAFPMTGNLLKAGAAEGQSSQVSWICSPWPIISWRPAWRRDGASSQSFKGPPSLRRKRLSSSTWEPF